MSFPQKKIVNSPSKKTKLSSTLPMEGESQFIENIHKGQRSSLLFNQVQIPSEFKNQDISPKQLLQKISDFPYSKTLRNINLISDCVEIVDNQGLPFLLMPLEFARKKKLPRRVFLAVLKDNKKRALIIKRREKNQKSAGLWTLSSTGSVLAGESSEGAVLRELQKDFHVNIHTNNTPIQELNTLPFMENETTLSATIFLVGPCKVDDIIQNQETIADMMFLIQNELEGLSSQHPEMFHPLLFWALRSGWIF